MKNLLQYAAALFFLICFAVSYFNGITHEEKIETCAFFGTVAVFGAWLSVVRIERNVQDMSE